MGANLVVCQHSHCIGCEEKYNDGTIVYGQGNFIFDYSKSEFWQTSLLVEITDDFEVKYIPIIKTENTIRLAKDTQSAQIIEEFYERATCIKQPEFIQNNYKKFSESILNRYLINFSGLKLNIILRIIEKLSGHRFLKWYIKKRFSKEKLLSIKNFVECESHRDLMLQGIENE